MYEEVSETARLGFTIVIVAVLVGIVLSLMTAFNTIVESGDNVLQENIDMLVQEQPDKEDVSMTYDEYQNKHQNDKYEEPEVHPAEVVDDGNSFWDYVGLALLVIGIIIAGGKVIVNILYIVFPFVFKLKVMEESTPEEEEDPYAYVNDDSRYSWVDELMEDTDV